MDGEDRRKRQLLVGHEDGNKRGRPIMRVKNLGRGCHPPREFHRGFAKENETRRVIFVGHAVFAVDARPIEERVAPDEECLHAARGPAFHKFRDVILLADGHIDRDPGIAQLDRHVLADLAIEWHRDPDFMFPRAQFTRQRLEHVYQRRRARERRTFRTDHQNAHGEFLPANARECTRMPAISKPFDSR